MGDALGDCLERRTMNVPIIIQNIEEATKFVSNHVCARCFGRLNVYAVEGGNQVRCPACEGAWGFTTVRKSTAERREQQAQVELREVIENMPDLFPNRYKGKSTEQLLDMLY